jgi:hypothetical protein
MEKPQMSDLIANEQVPVDKKQALHNEYLYPREVFDEALICRKPIIYSRFKILEILKVQILEDVESINEYIQREIQPLFDLMD